MSRIWSMMDMGKRSMINSQTALQTVNHNISSKNVEGFSRQRVETQTNEPIGHGRLRMGQGAHATSVGRINNQFIEKQLEKEGNNLGTKDSKANMLMRVEQVFNEQMNKGLNKFMGEFFNSYREMSNSPENLSLRSLVRESADFLASDFKRVNSQLTKIQDEADFQLKVEVGEINEITKELAVLNEKIQTAEINAREANDERDRREQLVKDLSKKINIRYGESEDGALTVTAGNSALLVSGSTQRDLIVSASGERNGKKDGNAEIFYKSVENSTPVNVTEQITGGSVGGLLSIRDKFINDTLKNVNELAKNLADEVNSAHREGFDRYNKKGEDFFTYDKTATDLVRTFKVSDSVMNDAGKIVAAGQANSPGDNRIANVISSLQYQQKMANGQSTFDDYYNNIVGNVGVFASRANSELESQKDIVNQLKNIRESISGVSLDEETAKMIEFQKTFDASARLIRTADEMMDTVLNLKPM
jgi:flagellar hook-associated protein 1 FlgK